jgi:hypothetical protein
MESGKSTIKNKQERKTEISTLNTEINEAMEHLGEVRQIYMCPQIWNYDDTIIEYDGKKQFILFDICDSKEVSTVYNAYRLEKLYIEFKTITEKACQYNCTYNHYFNTEHLLMKTHLLEKVIKKMKKVEEQMKKEK